MSQSPQPSRIPVRGPHPMILTTSPLNTTQTSPKRQSIRPCFRIWIASFSSNPMMHHAIPNYAITQLLQQPRTSPPSKSSPGQAASHATAQRLTLHSSLPNQPILVFPHPNPPLISLHLSLSIGCIKIPPGRSILNDLQSRPQSYMHGTMHHPDLTSIITLPFQVNASN